MENQKDIFIGLVSKYIKRDGIDSLMEEIKNSDFFTAPASTRFHGSCKGGLCEHSIAVRREMFRLSKLYGDGMYSEETLAIVSLFHDLCKIGCYKTEMRNVKDANGQWVKQAFYKFEEDSPFGGHGEKSVFIVMNHMKLTQEEAAAINAHMGFSNRLNITAVSNLYEKNLLAWMLHVADEAATYYRKV